MSRSFGVYKNAAAPIIAMLGRSEVNIEVSSTGMESVESDDYREMLGDNEDANRVLAVI